MGSQEDFIRSQTAAGVEIRDISVCTIDAGAFHVLVLRL